MNIASRQSAGSRTVAQLLIGVFLVLGQAGWVTAMPPDAVEGLRQVLKGPVHDLNGRDRLIREKLQAIQGVSDLHCALVIHEWRDEDLEDSVARVDRQNRAALQTRFEQSVRDVLRRGDPTARLAVLHFLATIDPGTRGVGRRDGLTRVFSADIASLLTHADPATRKTAAHTLGQINPDLGIAMPSLTAMLRSPDMSDRLAGADGLWGLMYTVKQLATRNHTPNAVEASRTDVATVSQLVLPVAGRGLVDAQEPVRRRHIETIGEAADALRRLIGGSRSGSELDDPAEYERQMEAERTELLPLIESLKNLAPALTRALADKDSRVRVAARQALEDMTGPQLRLIERVSAHTRETPRNGPRAPQFVMYSVNQDPLVEGMNGIVQAVAVGLGDQDPIARRASVDVLETLGAAAVPAAPMLVKALADPDRFVRWSAARTLGKISPSAANAAVPALTRLLDDADLDLKLTALTALERYGRLASPAVGDLVKALGSSDAELRVAICKTLGAIGGPDAFPAIPALIANLADPDVRVQKTAAEVLGTFGPAARSAENALRRLMQDGPAEVQKAASRSLLEIVR